MPARLNEILATFKQQAAADKKKTAVLGTLLLVLLVVLARSLGGGETPDSVAAAGVAVVPEAAPVQVDPVQPTVRATPESPVALPRATEPLPAKPPAAPAAAKPGPQRSVRVDELPRVLHRDLFSITGWRTEPPPGSETAAGPNGEAAGIFSGSGGLWNELGATIGQMRETRRSTMEKMEAELTKLVLQSTMTGAEPLAYVSGRLVREKDTIDGFSVLHIKDRRVVVRKYGLTRELKMP